MHHRSAHHNHRLYYTTTICIPIFLLLLELSDLTTSQQVATTTTTVNRNNFLSQRQQQQRPHQLIIDLDGRPLSDKENNLRLLAERQQQPKIITTANNGGINKRSESALLSRQYDTQQQHSRNVNPSPKASSLDNKFIIKRDSELQSSPSNSPYNDYFDRSEANSTLSSSGPVVPSSSASAAEDICADRLCYGLPMGCLDRQPESQREKSRIQTSGSLCSALVTSKRLIDPYRPASRDIYFEIVALPAENRNNYAAVGFSETGRMAGLVSECLQYRDGITQLQVIKLAHSYNLPGAYANVPVTILSGIKNLGVSYENGYYQCRWVVESAVEYTYEDPNGTVVERREDLGYKNYHILLAAGEYNRQDHVKLFHADRVASMTPVSLAQTGHIKSLGAHILIRIHGSLMVVIWFGLVTTSIFLARYYKNEWPETKINDLAIWFVVHRSFMLIAWFGSLVSVIFAYMYTETYHPGIHQLSGTTCLILSSIQVLGGLCRPSIESNKRIYFNWAHFVCGNLSYLFAMICFVTAAYLAPAHLPPIYMWAVAAFVAVYALTHIIMTIHHSSHQYVVHKSSNISITRVVTVIIYLLLLLLLLSTVIGTT